MALDPYTIEVSFDNIINETVFLEEFLRGESDEDLYERVLVAKESYAADSLQQLLYRQLGEYFSHALDAYEIVSVRNIYADRKVYVSDLPSNIYHITLADSSDTQRLMQDLSNI